VALLQQPLYGTRQALQVDGVADGPGKVDGTTLARRAIDSLSEQYA